MSAGPTAIDSSDALPGRVSWVRLFPYGAFIAVIPRKFAKSLDEKVIACKESVSVIQEIAIRGVSVQPGSSTHRLPFGNTT